MSTTAEIESDPAAEADGAFLDSFFATMDAEEANPSTPEAPNHEPAPAEEAKPDPEPEPEVVVEEKPVEEQVDPDLADLPAKASEATKIGWKQVKQLKREAEERAEKLSKEVEELRSKVGDGSETAKIQQELEQYRKQTEDYERTIALLDVTKSKEYVQNIQVPLDAANAALTEYISTYGLSESDVVDAVSSPTAIARNAKLAEITSGMNDFDKLEFKNILDSAYQLHQRKAQVEADAKTSLQYIEQQRRAEVEKKQQQSVQITKQTAKAVFDSVKSQLPFLSEDAALAAQIESEASSADFSTATPDVVAYAKVAAIMAPTLIQKYNDLKASTDAEIKKLKDDIAKRSGAGPRANSSGVPSSDSSDSPYKSFSDGLDAVLP